MAPKARIKTAAADFPVPQTRDQVIEAIADIGRRSRERARIETAMNDEMAAIRARYEAEAEPHAAAIKALSAGVQTWCEANRDTLTDGGKTKTVSFPSGIAKWRMTPPSVRLRAIDVLMEILTNRGLDRFLRVKTEINKEAILADPDAVAGVPGITIAQAEEFVIEPHEQQLAEAV